MADELLKIYYTSPLGLIEIKGTPESITSVNFVEKEDGEISEHVLLNQCRTELEEYFSGERKDFTVPLAPAGTAFQKTVWQQLCLIKHGRTASYMDIANRLNNPLSVRAVGLANGKNPIAIIIPCHRIIGADGSLTGYAGGLWRKQWLLELESGVKGARLTLF